MSGAAAFGHPAHAISVSRCVCPRWPSLETSPEVEARCRGAFERPDLFLDLDAALREAPRDHRVLGIGASIDVAKTILELDPDSGEARASARTELVRGETLGFEVVDFDGGITHALRCNVPDIALTRLGIVQNEHLLFCTDDDARRALARIKDAALALEEGTWVVVRVVQLHSEVRSGDLR